VIPVERAVQVAAAALPGFLGGRKPESVRVEEVVPSDNGGWRITLSHLEPGVNAPEHPLLKNLLRPPPAPERVLRVIEIDSETGEARRMVLRETA
jgi:hypothetical protein